MGIHGTRRMKALCPTKIAPAVQTALEAAGAQCISVFRTERANTVLYLTGRMSMKDFAINAGAKSFEEVT